MVVGKVSVDCCMTIEKHKPVSGESRDSWRLNRKKNFNEYHYVVVKISVDLNGSIYPLGKVISLGTFK